MRRHFSLSPKHIGKSVTDPRLNTRRLANRTETQPLVAMDERTFVNLLIFVLGLTKGHSLTLCRRAASGKKRFADLRPDSRWLT